MAVDEMSSDVRMTAMEATRMAGLIFNSYV